jgi:hypothetical protein
VLEKMGKARLSGFLVLGADVVPKVDVDDRQLVILVKNHVESVGQCELVKSDPWDSDFGRIGARSTAGSILRKARAHRLTILSLIN